MYYRLNICLFIVLLGLTTASAQERYKESFKASKDMLVEVNTSYTNVIFETWDKDLVEVEAFVDGEKLSSKEKKEIFDNWKFDVLGNSKKVIINSLPTQFGEGVGALAGLEALKSLSALKSLEKMPPVPTLPLDMTNFDFDLNFDVPEVPEFKDVPKWPFSSDTPNIKRKNSDNNFRFDSDTSITFDENTYLKDKQGYVNQLNKKFGTNVSTKQVDRWLNDVDRWQNDFQKVMEEWGENFGKQFEEKFGPEFERKMEAWGKDFGEKMEAWGEEFGEKFGKDMEKWGEEFGEKFGQDMEKWAEEFEKDAEKWAEEFDRNEGNYTEQVFTDKNGKKQTIHVLRDHGDVGGKVNKTIIVRMPKGTKTDVNVKYGELKMANAYNLKADLNYSKLTANSIDGGKTLINASYAPVYVNVWHDGALKINFVDDCRINDVKNINLSSNSSSVNINNLQSKGVLSGSFGSLFISRVADGFQSLDIVLENTDASIKVPNTAFDFYYNGKKSKLVPVKAMKLTESDNFDRKMFKGYHKNTNSGRSINITANFSNVSMQ